MKRSVVKANVVPLRSDRVSFYRFKSGIDADLEFICETIVKSGLSAVEIKARVSKAGGSISTSTISHWLDGTTRRRRTIPSLGSPSHSIMKRSGSNYDSRRVHNRTRNVSWQFANLSL